MLVRLGGPLAVAVVVDSQGGPLREAGFLGLAVCSYLATLVVETYLMVRMIPATNKVSTAAAAAGDSPTVRA
jgi:hypothetical protein